jgi:pimeloyl-ACP methyl ester carboxylesterase
LFFGQLWKTIDKSQQEWKEMKKETINHFNMKLSGINVYYELYTNDINKPVAVLIHGFLSSSFSYRRLIPMLKNDYTVLAVDLPPFGKSEKSVRFEYSYKNLARLVIHLLERLQIKETILVGHSMGGQIALNIVKQRPDLVKKIILLCSSGYMNRAQLPLIFSSYMPYFYLWVKYWLARQDVMQNLRNVVHDHSLIDDEMMEGYIQPFYDDRIFMALTRMIRDREGDLPSEDLRKIETPSLIIWGEEDRVVPVEVGKRLHQDLPNSTFFSLVKTGHLVPEEKPKHVFDYMMEFVHA